MPTNPYQSYLESEILSADPIKLVQLLYRGALEAIELARLKLRAGDVVGRGRAIAKATNIVIELSQSLDMEKGGTLALSLADLYAYILRRLNQAHAEQREAYLAECVRLLATLLEGWQACTPEPAPAAAPSEATAPLLASY